MTEDERSGPGTRWTNLFRRDPFAAIAAILNFVGVGYLLTKYEQAVVAFLKSIISDAHGEPLASVQMASFASRDTAIGFVIMIIVFVLLWSTWTVSYSHSDNAQKVAGDTLKTLLGFITGLATGLFGRLA